MTGNNQINYVVFDVENISKALDSASDLIAYEAPEMKESIELALYVFRTSIDRLHTAHDRLKEALRVLREKQCGEEEGKNAENGENSQ